MLWPTVKNELFVFIKKNPRIKDKDIGLHFELFYTFNKIHSIEIRNKILWTGLKYSRDGSLYRKFTVLVKRPLVPLFVS